jgi:hypothetical protein
MCISAYILGSSLLAYGLNCQEATGAIAVGSVLVSPLVSPQVKQHEQCSSILTFPPGHRLRLDGRTPPHWLHSRLSLHLRDVRLLLPSTAETVYNYILGWPSSLLWRPSYSRDARCDIPVPLADGPEACRRDIVHQGSDWDAGFLCLIHHHYVHSAGETAEAFHSFLDHVCWDANWTYCLGRFK